MFDFLRTSKLKPPLATRRSRLGREVLAFAQGATHFGQAGKHSGWTGRLTLWVRYGCGSKPFWYHFGVGTPLLVYFSWDWDVHWGYGGFPPAHNFEPDRFKRSFALKDPPGIANMLKQLLGCSKRFRIDLLTFFSFFIVPFWPRSKKQSADSQLLWASGSLAPVSKDQLKSVSAGPGAGHHPSLPGRGAHVSGRCRGPGAVAQSTAPKRFQAPSPPRLIDLIRFY